MSRPLTLLSLLGLTGLGVFLMADDRSIPGRGPAIKPRPTHETMARKQRPVRHETAREVKLSDVQEGKGAVDRNNVHRKSRQKEGLIGRSAILTSAYNWTLVPKGAVLLVPPLYGKRVNQGRKGKLIGWQDFYGKNRAWIKVVPVTLEQATGESPLSEEFLASLRTSGQVVVAACQGGPISIVQPEEAPEDEAKAAEFAREAAEKKARDAEASEDLKRRLLKSDQR